MYQIPKTYRQTNNIKTNNLFTKYITNYWGLHPHYLCDNLRILHSNKKTPPPPPPKIINNKEEYKVERILDSYLY